MSTAGTAIDERATLIERARRGADHEDVANPGWAARIDRQHLDMRSCFDCIIGQLHDGFYYTGLEDEAPEGLDDKALARWEVDHGFTCDINFQMRDPSQFEILRTAWLAEIARRLPTPIA